MSKKKIVKQVPISLRKYVVQNARKLDVYKCWIIENTQDLGMKQLVVTRIKKNGQLIVGTYLLDMYCLGLKDTFYTEIQSVETFMSDFLPKIDTMDQRREVDANYAFNLIHGAVEYAEDLGFKPEKDFAVTQYILEDAGDIDYIDIEFGHNGKPHFIAGPYDDERKIYNQLLKSVGEGNFGYLGQLSFEANDHQEFEDELSILQMMDDETFTSQVENRIKGYKNSILEHNYLIVSLLAYAIEAYASEHEDDWFFEYEKNPEELKLNILNIAMSETKMEIDKIALLPLMTICLEYYIDFDGIEFLLHSSFLEEFEQVFIGP